MPSVSVAHNPRRFLRYPLFAPERPPLSERLALRLQRFGPIRCPVCGRLGYATRFGASPLDFRDAAFCSRCLATNRQRQLAWTLRARLEALAGRRVASLARAARLDGLVVYNTEAQGPVHERLARMPGYRCSEYLGPDHSSGEVVGGLVHQDLTRLSYPDGGIDVVLSSDVLEHIPDPYQAHREVHRVLRAGGSHIFTVPFHQTGHLDERRARVDDAGRIVLLKEPAIYHTHAPRYHGDPTQESRTVLVYTIFGLEMLVRLRELGFATNLYQLHAARFGILGPNAIVFEAVKLP
jgi:SAM-dependent methyltransferase